ncbi:C6 finger domain containing protein [Colletotrichum tofieldiae]|uniref:C6 finger domain containing protein n=1 Tax=Colletotrichum tofieldiae TaxID=708197 RepID=A0A166QNC8_9PEZI|nr:C6 finger domain containing protein [Colletotrichum tofieldiae]
MRSTRYSTSRQKSCQQCATSKIKCDRKAGTCSRCQERCFTCVYPQSQASLQAGPEPTGLRDEADFEVTCVSAPLDIRDENAIAQSRESQQVAFRRLSFSEALLLPPTSERLERTAAEGPRASDTCRSPSHQHQASTTNSSIPAGSNPYQADEPDFSRLELTCPINADDIANRWLNSFVPFPGQKAKDYTPHISAFIDRILKSYASSSIRGHKLPPFVHWSQLGLTSSIPLSECISTLRVCDKSVAEGLKASAETLQKEMTKLFDQHKTADDITLLAIFQAHLIYSLVIFFQLGREHYPFLSQIMMNTQELACAAARKGLVCMAEQDGARPTWESWIVAEAKRRTLFTMCLFDSALLTHDGLPTYLATELRGLLAPASKSLWESRNRSEWQIKYNIHLTEWPEGGLRIDELWPIPEDLDKDEINRRRSRVDAWLEDLDEFGTMIYAVTSGTHGT